MKRAIKLLVLAGALLSVGALAQANQTWKFGFPTYAYIYTNSTEIYFDFTDNNGDGDATSVLSAFNAASLNNLESCIDGLVDNIGSDLVADGTAASSLGTCYFAPSGITHDGYSVDWSNVDSTGTGTDGSLLVVTNSSTYSVDVSVAGPPNGVTFLLASKMASDITGASDFTSFTSSSTSASSFADEGSDYTTQYYNAYVIPLSFAVGVTPEVAAQAVADYTMTYTISAQ